MIKQRQFTTLDGGSLGSWVEEDRGEMRELMVIAKFSRDSIDMSNAHCGDCLAGAIERALIYYWLNNNNNMT